MCDSPCGKSKWGESDDMATESDSVDVLNLSGGSETLGTFGTLAGGTTDSLGSTKVPGGCCACCKAMAVELHDSSTVEEVDKSSDDDIAKVVVSEVA